MNVSLKLISKVLALKMKKVMNHLVSDTQSAFIQNCQLSDYIIITTEVYSFLKEKKGQVVIKKLNFAKTFDTVKWEFVLIYCK